MVIHNNNYTCNIKKPKVKAGLNKKGRSTYKLKTLSVLQISIMPLTKNVLNYNNVLSVHTSLAIKNWHAYKCSKWNIVISTYPTGLRVMSYVTRIFILIVNEWTFSQTTSGITLKTFKVKFDAIKSSELEDLRHNYLQENLHNAFQIHVCVERKKHILILHWYKLVNKNKYNITNKLIFRLYINLV